MAISLTTKVFALLALVPHVIVVHAQFNYSFPDCVNGPLKSNLICDASANYLDRAKAVVSLFTVEELMANTVNTSPGVPRLGLPGYQWWSEGLHGVATSPGVTFAPSGEFSYATSFPQPILLGATFDDDLIHSVATVISTEARAFNNAGRAGMDFFTPNINPFKDPRWGRGQETPGEDPFHIAQYVFQLVQGLQGGINPQPFLKVVADCKHFAAYDLEDWEGNFRYGFNAQVSQQDLVEYYLPSFQSCVRDAKVASVMCSYNAVNGIPSCANDFLLQTVLREHWGFGVGENSGWVTSDCDAVMNIYADHHYVSDGAQASAVALKAGTDQDCGTTFSQFFPQALNESLITEADLSQSLVRQYASLVRLGYFDPASSQPYRQLGWSAVNTASAQSLAYTAAVEGIVLLKNNDKTLPLSSKIKNVAFIGPWANATTQMQGNYAGVAPFLISPVQAAENAGFNVAFTSGTEINSTDTSGFADALELGKGADMIFFVGGIDLSVEAEAMDRMEITWPGVQLDLITQLAALGKPLIVLQMGGGQVDDTSLVNNNNVSAIIWGGYPGQSGGQALLDIITGKRAPAGRLPITQYPASYVDQVPMTDMSLRPNASTGNPGRTYKWFTGDAVFPFGFGLHFTTFSLSWSREPQSTFNIQQLIAAAKSHQFADSAPLATFQVDIKNTGKATSDYVSLLFISGNPHGAPQPAPLKQLVAYSRSQSIAPGKSATADLALTLGSVARVDSTGDKVLYPGTYTLTVDVEGGIKTTFTLTGNQATIDEWPTAST